MATYKFEAIKRYGKYYANMRKATDAKPNLTKGTAMTSPEDIVEFFNQELERLNIVEDEDTIIFHDCGHTDFMALEREIRFANY